MTDQETRAPIPPAVRRGRALIVAALGAFVIAVLIHNRFGLDPAPVPAVLLTALSWWKPRRSLLLAAAIVIAVPAFSFLQWDALTRASDSARLWNHVFLLLAGLLAVAGAVVVLLRSRARTG